MGRGLVLLTGRAHCQRQVAFFESHMLYVIKAYNWVLNDRIVALYFSSKDVVVMKINYEHK